MTDSRADQHVTSNLAPEVLDKCKSWKVPPQIKEFFLLPENASQLSACLNGNAESALAIIPSDEYVIWMEVALFAGKIEVAKAIFERSSKIDGMTVAFADMAIRAKNKSAFEFIYPYLNPKQEEIQNWITKAIQSSSLTISQFLSAKITCDPQLLTLTPENAFAIVSAGTLNMKYFCSNNFIYRQQLESIFLAKKSIIFNCINSLIQNDKGVAYESLFNWAKGKNITLSPELDLPSAFAAKSSSIIKFLLDKNNYPDLRFSNNEMSNFYALTGDLSALTLSLNGIDFDLTEQEELVCNAAQSGSLEMLNYLLNKFPAVTDETPVRASKARTSDTLKFLLNNRENKFNLQLTDATPYRQHATAHNLCYLFKEFKLGPVQHSEVTSIVNSNEMGLFSTLLNSDLREIEAIDIFRAILQNGNPLMLDHFMKTHMKAEDYLYDINDVKTGILIKQKILFYKYIQKILIELKIKGSCTTTLFKEAHDVSPRLFFHVMTRLMYELAGVNNASNFIFEQLHKLFQECVDKYTDIERAAILPILPKKMRRYINQLKWGKAK